MTNKEAIEVIDKSDLFWCRPTEEEKQALYLAEKALDLSELSVERCPYCEYWDERLIRCNKHKDSMMYGVHDFCSKGKRKGVAE